MEDFLVNSSPNHEHFSNFSYSEGDGFRHTCRHNGMQYDKSKKLQTENEYLKEKVRSNERGLGKLYQVRKYSYHGDQTLSSPGHHLWILTPFLP